MNRGQFEIRYYKIEGNGIQTHCKVTEYGINTANYKCTMSFGSGTKRFCVVAGFSQKEPDHIYLDRIERKEVCGRGVNGSSLSSIEESMVKYVNLVLHTIKLMYPDIKQYTLNDQSKFYCNKKEDQTGSYISLAHDYLIKYNQTWYEKKFGARLPDSMWGNYRSSLKVLDEPIKEYDLIKDGFPQIVAYEKTYKESGTPRTFLNALRKELGEDVYCMEVGKWLRGYMEYLKIDTYSIHWYIPSSEIKQVNNAKKPIKLTEVHAQQINLAGGSRRQTRKSNKVIGIRGDYDESYGHFVGNIYDE